jgi:type IV pilus assembly protein PilW
MQRECGLTLVELLVSLLLSAMIASMLISVFLLIQKSALTQQALFQIQVNARTIDYLLGKALRNSGVIGCQHLHTQINISTEEGASLVDYGLFAKQGFKGIKLSELPKTLGTSRVSNRAVEASDLLWLQSIEPLTNRKAIKEGTVLIASDCQYASVFRWREKYLLPADRMINRLTLTIYYIGKTKRTNANNKPIYALYSTDLNGRTLELVEGVEQLVFSYGHLKNDQMIYQAAQEIEDWNSIISVRLKALLNSVEENEPIIKKWWNFEWPLIVSK